MNVDNHLSSFVHSFVLNSRRERWLDLLMNQKDKAAQVKSKLVNALDERYCRRVKTINGVDPGTMGVFFDFYSSPSVVPLSDAMTKGDCRDAIFSVLPGKLAIVFFHEGELWFCAKP